MNGGGAGPTVLSSAPNPGLFWHILPWETGGKGGEGREVLTAMPWPKPEPGCGLAALM